MAKNRLQFDINAKDKTKRAFGTLKRGLKGVSKAIFNMKTGLAAVAGVAGLGLLVRNSLKSIDKLGKLSRQVFISTEDLSAFRLAADLGGTSLEAFAKGARTMAVGVNDWLVKGTGIAQDAFIQLGITQEDLRATNGDLMAQFELVADALQNVKNEGDKTAIAYKLFGGRNIELLTAMEAGTAGMVAMGKEAKRFGLVLTKDMVKAVEDANDSIGRTKSLFTGVSNHMTVALAPAIQKVSDTLRDTLLMHVEKAHGSMEAFGKWLGTKFINTIGKIGSGFIKVKFQIINFTNELSNMEAKAYNLGTALLMAVGEWGLALSREIKHTTEVLKNNNEEMLQELVDWNATIFDITNARVDNEKKAEKTITNNEQKALGERQEQYREWLNKKSQMTSLFINVQETQAKREKEIREKANADLRSNIEGTLTILSGHSKKAFKMLQAHKIAEAIINTYSAVMKAFAAYGGTPMSYIAAGAALSFGMAQVSQIRAQKFTARRQGGIVSENKPYMVGEGGPETFIPNSAGYISPGVGGKNVNVTFNINAVDTSGFQQLLANERGMIVGMINSAVNQQGKSDII